MPPAVDETLKTDQKEVLSVLGTGTLGSWPSIMMTAMPPP
jgi:hypothetical protein